MSLDKLTLHAQLALLDKNSNDLQTSANAKSQEIQDLHRKIQELNLQLEHHRGALSYNQILVQQIQKLISELDQTVSTT